MTLSIVTTVSEPSRWGFPFWEALESYVGVADEVIVMNGGPTFSIEHPKVRILEYAWPVEWPLEFVGQQYTRALHAATGDWVIRMDADYVLHEHDYDRLRDRLQRAGDAPVVTMDKRQIHQHDRSYTKGPVGLCFQMGRYKHQLSSTGGDDLSEPLFKGLHTPIKHLPKTGVEFWNYDHTFMTERQVREQFVQKARARAKQKGFPEWGTDETCMEYFREMIKAKAVQAKELLELEDHPKVMREKIMNLRPEQLGYDLWGMAKELYGA